MKIRSFVDKYMGWCPRFESQINSLPPYTSLSISGRVVFTALLLLTGLFSVVLTMIQISNWIRNNFWTGSLGYPYVIYLLEFTSGSLLLILTFDFVTRGTVLRRHKLELLGFVVTSVMYTLYWLSFDVGSILYGKIAEISIFQDIRNLGFVVMGIYVAYRLLSDKKILVKNTFLFLSVFFTGELLSLGESTIRTWNSTTASLPLVASRMVMVQYCVVYGVAAIFFFKTYLELRRKPLFELSLPIYIRGIILLYGVSWLLQNVYNIFLFNPTTDLESSGGLIGFIVLVSFNFMISIAYILSSFHSLRFSVGETVTHINVKERGP